MKRKERGRGREEDLLVSNSILKLKENEKLQNILRDYILKRIIFLLN